MLTAKAGMHPVASLPFASTPSRPPLAPRPRQGDACVACGAPFQRSLLTWEVLPAVEFELEEGIGEEEALVG
jgi:hypothetical protein